MRRNMLIEDIIEWDIVNWSYCLDFWEKNVELTKSKKNCLEIGARAGGLSLWMALKGYDVICSDLYNPQLKARAIHEKYNISKNIKYEIINATNIPYENYFDIIMFKSVLGGIGKNGNKELQSNAMYEIYKALKPSGVLLFAENCAGFFLHQFIRKKFIEWGVLWSYVTLTEMKEFLAPFSSYKYTTIGFLGCFGRNEEQRSLLGKIDQHLLNKIIPEKWKYIIIGVALK
jgi:SAM-dependent methyltransferase